MGRSVDAFVKSYSNQNELVCWWASGYFYCDLEHSFTYTCQQHFGCWRINSIKQSAYKIYNFLCGPAIWFRVQASPFGVWHSHSLDTPHSIGLDWAGDQPKTETSTWQQKHTQETIIHAPDGIRIRVPQSVRLHTLALDRPAAGIGR
jgi:hypothetical protein